MNKLITFSWLILISFSLYIGISYFNDGRDNKLLYEEMRAQVQVVSAHEDVIVGEQQYDQLTEDIIEEKVIDEKFEFLLNEVNREIVGWITISNTEIDYPIVLTTDNSYYLDKDINKRTSNAGTLFMDFRNSELDNNDNTIIYGHNMKNGSMFNNLTMFKNEQFFNDNRIINYHDHYEQSEWEIFSVYVTSTDFNYIETNFPNRAEYESFLKSITERSLFNSNVEISSNDQILTLSTCDYDFYDARLVVHAKKITSS